VTKKGHAAAFGVTGNWNPSRAAEASRIINQHVNRDGVLAIPGGYKGNDVIHYLDPRSGLNVFSSPGGEFISGWRLGAEQMQGVLTTWRLF